MKKTGVVLLLAVLGAATGLLCVCTGSVQYTLGETLRALTGSAAADSTVRTVVLTVRLPRVLCVAFTGGALSLSGAAMQGLFGNPLADGTTLGVSSGASLGAVLSIGLSGVVPFLGTLGTAPMAMMFAFGSMMAVLGLAYVIDRTLSTQTLLLMGVIFSMLANSVITFVTAFAGSKLRSITFWTMGSLANTNYKDALLLGVTFAALGTALMMQRRVLDAFALGEDNARSIGISVKGVKLFILICVSSLIGVCVSVGGTIGFVGLVVPHMTRLLTGPSHKRLLPLSAYMGAVGLLLTDLFSRTVMRPVELPIGAVTSFGGALLFVYLLFRGRRMRSC